MISRILLCEEVPIVRDALRTLLDAQPDFDVVEVADNGINAIMLVRTLKPHVVVTGLRLTGLSGLEMISRLGREQLDPQPRFVVFTGSDNEAAVDSVLQAGVHGLLGQDATKDELCATVRAAAQGQILLAPPIAQVLVERLRSGRPRPDMGLRSILGQLTAREHQVLLLIGRGMSAEEIASELVIGVTTVRTHLYRLRCKLHLRDRAQVVSFAYRAGLMQLN
jgi:DNA-binding NarL/FixJ family response regulator